MLYPCHTSRPKQKDRSTLQRATRSQPCSSAFGRGRPEKPERMHGQFFATCQERRCDTLSSKDKVSKGSQTMKRTFLAKLHTNGVYYIIGACLLLVGMPLYQLVILLPQGYGEALTAADKGSYITYVSWLGNHLGQFLGYRALLVLAFAALFSLPFTLFRIIVAQEILGREDESDARESREDEAAPAATGEVQEMPADAWRGKGFAVLAAWSGLIGIILYILGTLASTIYLAVSAGTPSAGTGLPASFSPLTSTLSIIPNTLGSGLLALTTLFFGALIARSGLKLWPGMWVAFGYVALAVATLFSGSAIAIANAPQSQSIFTTPATLLFGLWVLWFGFMLVRLKPA
jgi:hypothetical protein